MLHCQMCFYKWEPNKKRLKGRLPKTCPRCKSYKWNGKKKNVEG
jgi:hypothetical protein